MPAKPATAEGFAEATWALGWVHGEVLGGGSWRVREAGRLQGDSHMGPLAGPCLAVCRGRQLGVTLCEGMLGRSPGLGLRPKVLWLAPCDPRATSNP